MIVSKESVEIESTEVQKTYAFSKRVGPNSQINYLNFYRIVGPETSVPSVEQPSELKCGDILSFGKCHYIVREFVDGSERTKYSGVASSY